MSPLLTQSRHWRLRIAAVQTDPKPRFADPQMLAGLSLDRGNFNKLDQRATVNDGAVCASVGRDERLRNEVRRRHSGGLVYLLLTRSRRLMSGSSSSPLRVKADVTRTVLE